MDAGERGGVAKNFTHLVERFFVREKNTLHFAEGSDGKAIEYIVPIFEQHLGHADEGSVEFIALQHLGQFGWRGEDHLFLETARQRHGVEVANRTSAERRQRLEKIAFALD